MYAEFSLLEDSPEGPSDKKISLKDALRILQNNVTDGLFSVKIPTENIVMLLFHSIKQIT